MSNYSPQTETLEKFRKIKFVALVAPTSTGRNTIIRELVKTGKYEFIVSDTTRQPQIRDGVMEKDGVEYHFRTEEEFLTGLMAGDYLEAELVHEQQVSGIHIDEINKLSNHERIAITDMNITGGELVAGLSTNARVIVVTPPSLTVWMERLSKQGQLSQEEIQRRMQSAESVLERSLQNDRFWFLRNDDLKDAVMNIRDIIENNEPDYAENSAAKQVAWKVLGELKAALSS